MHADYKSDTRAVSLAMDGEVVERRASRKKQ